MDIRAIAFDTGGTVLDWHSGLAQTIERVAVRHEISVDAHALANEWRRRSMKKIVGQIRPQFNMDDVHRVTLREVLADSGLKRLDELAGDEISGAWYRLTAWPDFPECLHGLTNALPVVSFTMLPVALAIHVSRRNQLNWSAIISCEMIGTYKPHHECYETVAEWLNVEPSQILMVACHNFDLNAAHAVGFRTAFVRRLEEWGPHERPEAMPNMAYDFVVADFAALANQILGRLAESAREGARRG